jgi:hypothetical protein
MTPRQAMLGFAVPFPTRMTIVRLGHGDLFVHSPAMLTPELKPKAEAIGTSRYLVRPLWLHFGGPLTGSDAFPDARVFVAKGVRRRVKHIDFDAEPLGADKGTHGTRFPPRAAAGHKAWIGT